MRPATADPLGAATARTPGYDVARALAILGMIIVNYKSTLGSEARGPHWLVWLSNRLDGRAATIFVVLAGVGAALRSRRARVDPQLHLISERRNLAKRGLLLLLFGLANLHLWESDILHFYGVYLLLAVPLLAVSEAWLWIIGVIVIGLAPVVESIVGYYELHNVWSAFGFVSDVLFNGLHPIFPWLSLLILGMWLGRANLSLPSKRRRIAGVALGATLAAELLDAVATRLSDPSVIDPWYSTSPSPPYPGFVIAAGGTAVVVVCLCIEVGNRYKYTVWLRALMATGQMAFTLYIAHAAFIMMALQHQSFHLAEVSLATTIGISFAFYAAAVAFSVWWRLRWNYGPLEGFVRQVAGQGSPASWGGERMSLVPPSERGGPPPIGAESNGDDASQAPR